METKGGQGSAATPGPEGEAAPSPLLRRAVALQYDPAEDSAPRVVAEGSGVLAERIIELAREHRVAIREDPLLVQALAQLEVGEAIPSDLYVVVAEVFAWLYHLQDPASHRPPAEGQPR